MTAFITAWALLKMPFVAPDKLPKRAWDGVMGSVSDFEHQKRDDFWVDDEANPKAWGLHRRADYTTGNGTHIGARIPYFEIDPSMRGKGKGREALVQMIAEMREHEKMNPDSKVMGQDVIESAKGFWERMYEDGIIHDYTEE